MSDKRPFTYEDRAPYLAYFEDGIWDILLGIWLLTFALSLLLEAAFLPALVVILSLPLAWQLKQRLTLPRLQTLHYTPEQLGQDQRRTSIVVFWGELLMCLAILLFIALWEKPAAAPWLVAWGWLPFGVMVALSIGLVGYLYRAMNWAIYAFLLLVSVLASPWFGLELSGCIMLAGVLVLISGAGILRHFMQSHPPQTSSTV